jgi:hypothetical protein
MRAAAKVIKAVDDGWRPRRVRRFRGQMRVKQVRRRRLGLASSSVHVRRGGRRRGHPPPHGSRRYRPPPPAAFTWTTAASKHVPRPPPILWRTAAGQGGCRRAGKCARSQSRFWLDVRLRHQGQAQCGDGTCTEDSPQECPRITEPAAATQRVDRQCRGGVWLVRGLPHNVRQMLLGDDSDTLR